MQGQRFYEDGLWDIPIQKVQAAHKMKQKESTDSEPNATQNKLAIII